MRFPYLLAFAILLNTPALAQKNERQLSLSFGRSFHGTGDMNGVYFATEYGRSFGEHLEWGASLQGNIHNRAFNVWVTDNGIERDMSARFVTAGVQLEGAITYAPLKTRHHEFGISLGPLLRYQSSSYPSGYSFRPPSLTLPEATFSFRQTEDQNLFLPGYHARLVYRYSFQNRLFLGARFGFQNDSNADVITHYGLNIGRRF